MSFPFRRSIARGGIHLHHYCQLRIDQSSSDVTLPRKIAIMVRRQCSCSLKTQSDASMNPERWMRLARAIPRTLDSYSTPNRYVEAYEEGEPIPGTSCSLGGSKSSILFCVLLEGFKRLSEVKKNCVCCATRPSISRPVCCFDSSICTIDIRCAAYSPPMSQLTKGRVRKRVTSSSWNFHS